MGCKEYEKRCKIANKRCKKCKRLLHHHNEFGYCRKHAGFSCRSKPCLVCGLEYSPNHHSQKFCVKCRLIKRKEYRKENREYYRAYAYNLTVEEYGKLTKDGCVICGIKEPLDIHHKDKNHKNNKKGNLVCLCPNHHALIHRNIKTYEQMKKEKFKSDRKDI